ncbi:MATE efflux family protein [[Clostridium] methylpentosum DSM 5476]|uniref:Probable multidrug resistance protein NorM n=1 Tax=[Clostridium] methylpentosum DSM 5476 TaxID=537013 RepID=C0E9Y9_9FIRM|nr:MATE efflux family protein [[Clostridium] methylpentosum DSM 5476]MDY3989281.1 MATE family efflux transporter [Massilioclostridium sp.]
MEQIKQNKMGIAPIPKLIVSMSLPAMFSMLVQALYNIIDSMFVAQLGESALTSVSLAFPVQTLMIAVAVGTGIGINSLVSRRLGERRREEASRAATHGLLLAIFSSLVFALLGLTLTQTFFQAFTDNQTVLQMGCDYTYVVTIFSFGMMIEIGLEKTLQATGNMIYPMLFQLSGAVINIILDPIFIFGKFGVPALGVRGAAVATVIGQIASMVFAVVVIIVKKHEVHISFRNFKFKWRTVKEIYAVGFPSIIMQSIMAFLVTMLNTILISFSEAAVSVLGVYYKLQSFVFMPVFGLTHGVLPIIGYNYGAGNKKRLLSALRLGTLIAACIMTVGTVLFLAIPDKLLMIFNASPQMLEIGVPALRIISICFIPAAVDILFSTFFQGVGMGFKSLIVSIMRQLVVILPAAYLLSKIGLGYTWYAFPIAEVVSLVLGGIFFWTTYRSKIRNLRPISD